jgi:hypothetical protein
VAEDVRIGRPITGCPIGPVGRAVRWAKRRPAAATLVAVAIVALIGFVGRWIWLERQETVRRDRARQAITVALAEADALRAEVRGVNGLQALTRVESLLSEADSDDLRRRLEDMKAALHELQAADLAAKRLREGVCRAPRRWSTITSPSTSRRTAGRSSYPRRTVIFTCSTCRPGASRG